MRPQGCLKLDENVMCISPAARVIDASPTIPITYAIHMRDSPCLHRPRTGQTGAPKANMGASPGITLGLQRAPPASAGPRNIGQAYGRRAEGSFPVFGPLWKVGKRQWALSGGQRTARPAMYERFPRA